MSRNYDNWERLVEAVLDREKLRQLAREFSFDSTISDISSRFSFNSTPTEYVPEPSSFPSRTSSSRSHESFLNPRSEAHEILSRTKLIPFSFDELKNATDNFQRYNHLGEGRFCDVYKGSIDEHTFIETGISQGRFGNVFKRWTHERTSLPSVKHVSRLPIAVKKFKPERFDQDRNKWITEIDYLGKLHHPNLVKLLGYCSEGDNRLLVYEFMPKGNLNMYLSPGGRNQTLSWETRVNVAIGVARCLSFLHDTESSVHGDVKSSSILLDGDFSAKLSGFTLPKFDDPIASQFAQGAAISPVTWQYEHPAPEYGFKGELTAKSDVYSFGIVLLELLCGRPSVDTTKVYGQTSLVEWARLYLLGTGTAEKLFQIMDTKLEGIYPKKGASALGALAFKCLEFEPIVRPCMTEVLAALEGLNDPQTRLPNIIYGEHVATGGGWSSLVLDGINGWTPHRADSLEKIDKIGQDIYSVSIANNKKDIFDVCIGKGVNKEDISSVYKGRDVVTGKTVALKKTRLDNLDPDTEELMTREVSVVCRLDHHPNVVRLQGLVVSRMSNSLYLVFDYMDHDLARLASSPRIKFTEPQVKCYMHQLLSGLEHCHNRHVLHRDIKGSNLLIDDGGVLKIADFGSASIFDPNNKHPMTSHVVTLWWNSDTLWYRSPELLLGAKEYGVGVDLWSAGCILAELLAGKPIMTGRTEVEQLHMIFKLCGSPSEEYWKKSKLPHATIFKPQQPLKRCIRETFKDFPQSSLSLIDSLLAIDPSERQTATAALKSESSQPHLMHVILLACQSTHQATVNPCRPLDRINYNSYK